MTKYIGIKGSTIEKIAGDPANPIPGEVWYNSSSNVLKGYAEGAGTGAWAAGGDIINERNNFCSWGTQTAAIIAVGGAPSPSDNVTELYDGTSWSDGNSCLTAREAGGAFGTQAAAMNTSGQSFLINESWDGTCWTEDNNPIVGRAEAATLGTQTAGMFNGGQTPPLGYVTLSETWNGTSYSEGNNLNGGRTGFVGAGTTSAGIVAAGGSPVGASPTPSPKWDETETWDGTSWTEVADCNTARSYLGGASAGTSTAYLIFGGNQLPGTPSKLVEAWNGTSWSVEADLAVARNVAGGSGTAIASITMGGSPGVGKTALTEEWTKPDAVVTFTSS